MLRTATTAIVILTLTGVCLRPAFGQEHTAPGDDLDLSDGVRTLLQAEMRELAAASQAAVIAFVSGDWESIRRLGDEMQASYVMQQSLTASQKSELAERLPDRFRRMDLEFHERAGRLGRAAASRDPELVAFHLHRLLETCASCHAQYAGSRFPGFTSDASATHRH